MLRPQHGWQGAAKTIEIPCTGENVQWKHTLQFRSAWASVRQRGNQREGEGNTGEGFHEAESRSEGRRGKHRWRLPPLILPLREKSPWLARNAHLLTYAQSDIRTHTHTHTDTHACTHSHIHTQPHTHIYTHTNSNTHTHSLTHTHTHRH